MMEVPVQAESLLAGLPPVTQRRLSDKIAALIRKANRKVIVLDDDPTGTQTVHGVPIVTKWTVEHLSRELVDPSPVSFVLTNSRSIEAHATGALHCEISANLREASLRTGDRDYTVISRSDSTLRGHFWEEMTTLSANLGNPVDAWIVCPYFEEGGRLTIDDVHYVADGERLVPAAQTPFAQDAVFGYRSSNLRQWIVEKSGGRIEAGDIESLSIQELRCSNPRHLEVRIDRLCDERVVIINSAHHSDLETAVCALLEAESRGMRFLYRSAASFVSVRSGIAPSPLLDKRDLMDRTGCGVLIVVGSHVPKTTQQLEHLRQQGEATFLEFDVREFLDSATGDEGVAETAKRATCELAADRTVVVYTSRRIAHASPAESLHVGKSISRGLVKVVREIGCRPRLLIAKGGVTSSDLATEALGLERSIVMGQVLPGVPVWKCGRGSRYPGMALVVFPGNVGTQDSLSQLVDRVT